MEEVGELDYDHRLFVSVCEAVIDPEEFEYAKWCGNGRPKADRVSIFKAYILKMTLNLKGDKELVELLRQQPLSRRMCGWGSAPKKIALHILLGIIVIAVEQTIRMLC